jgi:signal transduction histidine kinase
MLSTLELKPLLQRIFAQFARVLSYNSILVMTLQGDELEVLAYHGPPLPEVFEGKRFPQALWQPQTRQVIDTRQRVYVPDITAEPGLVQQVAQLIGCRPYNRTKLILPLIAHNELIGLLSLHHEQPDYYSERDQAHVQAFASQIAIALENARLYTQAREAAAAEERNRLARDLHDAVSQKLFSASIIADALPDAWQQSPAIGQQGLGELQALMRGALAEMRTLLLELRPAALTERPLHQLLEALITSVASRNGMTISLDAVGDCDLPPDMQIALYRIVQEALNNSSKHAQAQHVEVRLWCGPQGGELRIRDDGTGFVPDAVGPEHMGMRIMQERAAEAGATVDIQTSPGSGTEIVVVWTYRDT